MKFNRFIITQNGKHIGSCGVVEQARKAAMSYAKSTGMPVRVEASVSDGSREPRSNIYHPDGRVEKLWKNF